MALSEHISINAKCNKKLQVEQHLFPLQPASAISLSQEVLPDTEQSLRDSFCKFMAGAINFFNMKKKTTFSCRWPTLCFCCCKKDPGMAFGLSSKEVTEWLQCLLPLCKFPKALTQCDSYSRFKPHGQGHRFWGWESKSSTQKHFHSVSRNFSLDGKGKRKKKKQTKPTKFGSLGFRERLGTRVSPNIRVDSIGQHWVRPGCKMWMQH